MSPTRSDRHRRARNERGAASIELVILLPALFAVMFLGMQAALYYHARTIAIAAAQEGARAAGAEGATSTDGRRSARAYLADVGGDALKSSRVNVTRTGTTATATVTGRSLSVLPGWQPRVRQSASVTVERLTAP
ncbi:TadE-like protein [Nocardioides albertanoniae]|uniref:TadE-like protein n=1 Tax=Nocardioides albertanoniae TaxID=1175486 RepID=A0A543A8A8_9ACTN|nr:MULTISPECIES: TadE family protein [Nocardioides]TQL68838.1 TadE-like protein [Nocardioides albertanoniae]